MDCFAALAMAALARRPLDTGFAYADFARSIHYRRPGVIRQGDAVPGALGPGFSLGIARNQHRIGPDHRPGGADEVDMARDLCIEHMGGIDHLGINMERQHAVGEAAPARGGPGSGQRALRQLLPQRLATITLPSATTRSRSTARSGPGPHSSALASLPAPSPARLCSSSPSISCNSASLRAP